MNLAPDLFAYPWSQTTINNCNAYALGGAAPILFDPGHTQLYGHVEMGLSSDGLPETPPLVVITHCHPDHLEAALKLQKAGSKLAMHPLELAYMEGEGRQLATALGMSFPEVTVDVLLEEGSFQAGDKEIEVYHTPGHSPGHVCLYIKEHKALVAGDLIFAQGVGRVDFPGGDGEALKSSITRMAELDLEYVLPGHGPILKGAESIKRNFEIINQLYFPML